MSVHKLITYILDYMKEIKITDILAICIKFFIALNELRNLL